MQSIIRLLLFQVAFLCWYAPLSTLIRVVELIVIHYIELNITILQL